jgi:hypothetical protein
MVTEEISSLKYLVILAHNQISRGTYEIWALKSFKVDGTYTW